LSLRHPERQGNADSNDVTAVYGPLGAVLGFLLVVYFGIYIVLLGAELVAAWPEQAAAPPPR
jgi:uncharacterized BrkB/YihY/UPF0761 family membrane protein